MLDQEKSLSTVGEYLHKVGREINEDAMAIHVNLHVFADEVSHNSDMTKEAVMAAIGNFELFTANALAHIEGVLGQPLDLANPEAPAESDEAEALDADDGAVESDETDAPAAAGQPAEQPAESYEAAAAEQPAEQPAESGEAAAAEQPAEQEAGNA